MSRKNSELKKRGTVTMERLAIYSGSSVKGQVKELTFYEYQTSDGRLFGYVQIGGGAARYVINIEKLNGILSGDRYEIMFGYGRRTQRWCLS